MIDLEAVRKGEASRDAWVAAWWPRVYRMALALTGHEADAEDLAQETMVATISGADRFRGESSEGTWLYAILLRKSKSRRRPSPPPLPPRREPDLDGAMALLSRLPSAQRITAALFYVEDMTVDEIARALGVPRVTVRWRLWRARQKLRKDLP